LCRTCLELDYANAESIRVSGCVELVAVVPSGSDRFCGGCGRVSVALEQTVCNHEVGRVMTEVRTQPSGPAHVLHQCSGETAVASRRQLDRRPAACLNLQPGEPLADKQILEL